MEFSDEFLQVDTPENVIFGYEVSRLGSRGLASILDTGLLIALQVLAYMGYFLLDRLINIADIIDPTGVLIAIASSTTFLIFWLYFILFELLWNGQSPGKRWQRLRVIRHDGSPVNLASSVIRNLIRVIDFFPFFYSVGILSVFLNKQGKRLGDMAAGTLVIHDQSLTLEQLQKKEQAINLKGLQITEQTNLPIERLSPADIEIAEGYLKRRRELTVSNKMMRPILTRLYAKMDVELEEKLPATEALNRIGSIVSEYRVRRNQGESPSGA